ncbi:MAG: hypothetical protein LBF68_02025 [Christensenellaceae bacterium]|jgi:hypothetical protein|nr:hypothetical protein [Christensenellaceae bacterium]
MIRKDIRNNHGALIGYSQEDNNRISYYLSSGGLIGWFDKIANTYYATGEGGSGLKARSDIGIGQVYYLANNKRM